MRVWRIRRYSGTKGGSNYYHHADVIATTWWRALRAAKEGRVNNWRWIDRYDTAEEDYESYEYMYEVTDDPRDPGKPLSKLKKRICDHYDTLWAEANRVRAPQYVYNNLRALYRSDMQGSGAWPPLATLADVQPRRNRRVTA